MMTRILKQHVFTLWLCVAVGLAICFPVPASKGGCLRPEWTTQWGVALIFFLQGVVFPTRSLIAGCRPRRIHLFVLSWNYLWFPLVTGLVLYPLSALLTPDLRLGFGLLAILPTTIASAIVWTAITAGDTAIAIVATIASNLLAVLIVPIIAVAYFASQTVLEIEWSVLWVSLTRLLILPLLLGQVLRYLLNRPLDHLSVPAKMVNHAMILFIVHAAFAQGVSSGFLTQLSPSVLSAVLLGVVVLLLVTSTLVWISAAWLRIDHSQRMAAFFCASQKSLASGLPLASSILLVVPGMVDWAVVLIPLLCFHPLQLLFAGVVSQRLSSAG